MYKESESCRSCLTGQLMIYVNSLGVNIDTDTQTHTDTPEGKYIISINHECIDCRSVCSWLSFSISLNSGSEENHLNTTI